MLAGIPAQAAFSVQKAEKPCPMMQNMKGGMEMPCKDCPGHAKEQTSKKDGCCNDPICNAKCSVSAGKVFQSSVIGLNAGVKQHLEPLFVAFALSSLPANPLEKPPKFLS